MKKIKYLLEIFICLCLFNVRVYAADFSYSITSSSMTIGNNVTLVINGSNLAGKFSISSSNTSVAKLSSADMWLDNNTQSITISGVGVGTSIITITPVDVTTYNEEAVTNKKTITVTVNAKPVIPSGGGSSSGSTSKPSKAKSSNNYLASLSLDNLELDKSFDKQIDEYNVNAPAGTEKIKINAQLDDSKSKVNGLGEHDVSEGNNTFELIVEAENGSKKTYKVNVIVASYDPIEVKLDKKNYLVVRKRKDLPIVSEYFQEKDIIIKDNNIEGYYNETLKIDLVGLKDENGKIDLYIYKNNKYTLYNEITVGGKTYQVLDRELSKGYNKTSFNYDGKKISSYQIVKLDILKNTYALDNNEIEGNKFYIFYAVNLETGREELYQYDEVEKTIQRYNTQLINMYKEQSNKYYMYLIISIIGLSLAIITFSLILIVKNKKRVK